MLDTIFAGADALQRLRQAVSEWKPSQVCVVADENTATCCYPLVKDWLPPHSVCVISAGEARKTLETCQYVWAHFTAQALDRSALVLNVGGGMVGDLGGFCAATYKRGIRFAQVPTTLLAMVDASVGGKVGIDFQGLKNQLGAFQQPEAVFVYPPFLQTLSARELRSGMAEVIKHHLIAEKFLPALPIGEELLPLILHSIRIKAAIVAQDPLEKSIRKALNFGHTLGHAIESYFLTQPAPLLHGEAVAAGMVAEAYMSWQRNLLSAADYEMIKAYIYALYQDIFPKISAAPVQPMLKLLIQDKKNEHGQVLCTLLEGMGNVRINQSISQQEAAAALQKSGF